MRKLLILLAFLLALSTLPQKAYAAETSAGSSAQLSSSTQEEVSSDARVIALQHMFQKYNSPLTEYAPSYVKYADQYGVDWKLLPAISGVESTFGRFLLPDTHNAYGWGGGTIYFKDWNEGIDTINKAIRGNYMDKWGAKDVYSIAPIYAESKTWAPRVASFMEEINQEYIKISSKHLAVNL